MRIIVEGLGVVGGFGCGVDALEEALQRGVVEPGEFTVPTGAGPVQIPAYRAATDHLSQFVPKKSLRRMDHLSKLALLGGCLALSDGGIFGGDLSGLGLVIASGYGATTTTFSFLDSIIADGDVCASPTHFANSVHNAAAASIAIMLGVKGPTLTVSQFDMSVPSALLTARQWLAEGRCERVLFGAVDEISELVGYLWHRRRVAAPDAGAEILGEGAAFFLLGADKGEQGRYCAIDDVTIGRGTSSSPDVPQDGFFLLNGGGARAAAAQGFAAAPQLPSFSGEGIYGASPASAGFDLAIAALLLKRETEVQRRAARAVHLSDSGAYAVTQLSRF